MNSKVENIEEIFCPSCKGREIFPVGKLPDSQWFAGRRLAEKIDGGWLIRCRNCSLCFRYPIAGNAKLMRLYESASGTHWSGREIRRPDHKICETLVFNHKSAGKLLDIGCHTGEFLVRFRGTHSVYGIEPMPEAAYVARQRGIEVIGDDYRCLRSHEEKFDVITAIDVIEHVPNPMEFIAVIMASLAPGGVVIVSTGDAQSRAMRFFGAKYWYCGYPEHVAFICEDWLKFVANKHVLSLVELRKFRRFSPLGIYEVLADFSAQLIFFLCPNIWRAIQSKLGQDPGVPPAWRLAVDHIAAAIKKADSQIGQTSEAS